MEEALLPQAFAARRSSLTLRYNWQNVARISGILEKSACRLTGVQPLI